MAVEDDRFIRVAGPQLQFRVGKQLGRLLAVGGIRANRLIGEDVEEARRVHRRAGLCARIVPNHVTEVVHARKPGDPPRLGVDQLEFLCLVGSPAVLGDRVQGIVGRSGVVVNLHSKQLPPGGDAHELQPVADILADVQRSAVLARPHAVRYSHGVVPAGVGGRVIE